MAHVENGLLLMVNASISENQQSALQLRKALYPIEPCTLLLFLITSRFLVERAGDRDRCKFSMHKFAM